MEELVRRIAADVKVCEAGPWMLPDATFKPTCKEEGTVFVIGVGGSTVRLTEVTVSPSSTTSSDIISTSIPEEAKSGNIFAWCAAQVVPPLAERFPESAGDARPLIAVSWSFPLFKGQIMSMGKSFGSKYNGKDLLGLFNAELPAKFAARSATHDGTSSLVAGLHRNSRCRMALTLGTGVNINVQDRQNCLINTEISMLGRQDTTPNIELFPQEWDVKGPISEFQPFETRVSGLYLSQMVSKLLDENVTTEAIWDILKDCGDARYKAADDVVMRAASLVAAAIYGLHFALVSETSLGSVPEIIEVVYTGGVIFEPQFRSRLEAQLAKLANVFPLKVGLAPLRDGSEVGAAIAALHSIAQTAEITNGEKEINH